jgi:ArsR family transcriptional regulator, arsenate/arsenite/antimonite-responsive transcriptional repressor
MTTLVKIGAPRLKPAQLASALKALADENRLRILSMLNQSGCCSIASNSRDKGMCACDIESQLDLSQPTISHHMKILREAGLVSAEKVGSWIWYRRNDDLLQQISHTLSTGL